MKRSLHRRYGHAHKPRVGSVRSARVHVVVAPVSLDLLAPPKWERDGVLTAETSQGLPVVVIDGVAMGPADLPPGASVHVLQAASFDEAKSLVAAARRAGFDAYADGYVIEVQS
jgi:hypothetical protein